MTHGSLFSGIGGPDLAAEWMGWKNVFHCEKEQYKLDQLHINFPNTISYGDITTTDFNIHRGKINVLTGGFPCQDASVAKQWGKGQQGILGERTGLIWHALRAIDEIRPDYAPFENVENILRTNGGDDFRAILSELARMGYNAEWRVCRASDVGAPPSKGSAVSRCLLRQLQTTKERNFLSICIREGIAGQLGLCRNNYTDFSGRCLEGSTPSLCVDDGVSSKLVRQSLHGYGNAIVRQVIYEIFKAIQEYERRR